MVFIGIDVRILKILNYIMFESLTYVIESCF